jgi:hypothetical protein
MKGNKGEMMFPKPNKFGLFVESKEFANFFGQNEFLKHVPMITCPL